jgi:hypothetical protein
LQQLQPEPCLPRLQPAQLPLELLARQQQWREPLRGQLL